MDFLSQLFRPKVTLDHSDKAAKDVLAALDKQQSAADSVRDTVKELLAENARLRAEGTAKC